MQSKQSERVWFITGCSSGFGRELALAALHQGDKVVATARQPDSMADIAQGFGDRCLLLPLDVTQQAQVTQSVAQALARFGAIDVLVNNAGRGFMASIEDAADPDVSSLFELNFFGLVRMTKAVLPSMRQRRSGHIVNITSTGGLVGRAGSGYYAATKFAVEGLSEALAQEVEPYGINVTIVAPSGFRTRFPKAMFKGNMHDYETTAGERMNHVIRNDGKQAGDPARAALAIIQAVSAPKPPLHLLLGNDAVETARKKFKTFETDIQAWESISRGVDFD